MATISEALAALRAATDRLESVGKAKALIPRMRCSGKLHRRKLEIPATAWANGNGDRIVPKKAPRVFVDGRWTDPAIMCEQEGPCYSNPAYANVRAPMKPVTVIGKTNAGVACSPRCTGATGDDCECECGGNNHGIDA